MAKFERFEDIEGWKKARDLSRAIYTLSNDGSFSKDRSLRDQIRRAAISVLSNIAEGFERGGDREFHQFLATAKASLGEVKAQLYIALDAKYVNQNQFDSLYALASDATKTISGLMKYLATSEYCGNKYKDMVSDNVMPLDFKSKVLDFGHRTLDGRHG
jgi:four helix bundle protein